MAGKRMTKRPSPLFYGLVTAVYENGTVDVQVQGATDISGAPVVYSQLATTRAAVPLVGQYVVGSWADGAGRQMMPFLLGESNLTLSTRTQSMGFNKTTLWFPRQKFNQQRQGTAAIKGKMASPFYPKPEEWNIWKVSNDRTDIIRAGSGYLYQVCIDANGDNFVRSWAFATPKDEKGVLAEYTPAVSTKFNHNPSAQEAMWVWLDKSKGLVWMLRGFPNFLEIYDEQVTSLVLRGPYTGDSYYLAEPVRVSDTRTVALRYTSRIQTIWHRYDVGDAFIDTGAVAVQRPLWHTAPRLPNSSQGVSYPIWCWNDYDSPDQEPGLKPSVITDSSGKYLFVPGTDQAVINGINEDRGRQYELDTSSVDANLAHIYSLGQLQCLDSNLTIKWSKDYWGDDAREFGTKTPTAAKIGTHNTYAGVTPVISVGDVVYSHCVVHKFYCQRLHFVTFDNDLRDRMAQLRIDDPQSFQSTDWWTRAPAPPWAWSSNWISQQINKYMLDFKPGNVSAYRDIQTSHTEMIVGHSVSTGGKVSELSFPVSSVKTIKYDTGDPGSTPYGSRQPRRFHVAANTNDTDGGLVQRIGTASSSTQTLRQILSLTDDEKCVLWFAIERYDGTKWPGWDVRYNYYYGTAPAFDSQLTPFPVYTTTGAFAFNGSPPYWENEYNGFTTVAYPYGDMSSEGQYRIGGNITTGYRQSGQYSTFYTAHNAYCLGADGTGSIQYNEPVVAWTDYTDPDGNFDRKTVSVEYHAWVVRLDSIPTTITDPLRGWSVYNPVYDGRSILYFLPRRVPDRDPVANPAQDAPTVLPTAKTLAPTILRYNLNQSGSNGPVYDVLTTPIVTQLTSAPVGLAYVADDVAKAASILWMWANGTIVKFVNGAVSKTIDLPQSKDWDTATILYADGAIWLSGTGTGSALYKIDVVKLPSPS